MLNLSFVEIEQNVRHGCHSGTSINSKLAVASAIPASNESFQQRDTLNLCCFIVGPPSTTPAQH